MAPPQAVDIVVYEATRYLTDHKIGMRPERWQSQLVRQMIPVRGRVLDRNGLNLLTEMSQFPRLSELQARTTLQKRKARRPMSPLAGLIRLAGKRLGPQRWRAGPQYGALTGLASADTDMLPVFVKPSSSRPASGSKTLYSAWGRRTILRETRACSSSSWARDASRRGSRSETSGWMLCS